MGGFGNFFVCSELNCLPVYILSATMIPVAGYLEQLSQAKVAELAYALP